MKQCLALAAVLMIAACDKQADAVPAADTTATDAPLQADSMAGMPTDSTMVRDTASE